ncbi:hypothetical protein D3C79_1003190 [compost metagenome]
MLLIIALVFQHVFVRLQALQAAFLLMVLLKAFVDSPLSPLVAYENHEKCLKSFLYSIFPPV